MPKPTQSATKLVLREYDTIPSGRWVNLRLVRIGLGEGLLTLTSEVVNHPDQLGRQIEHVLPALLRPGSPLTGWLAAAFGIRLAMNESLELADLVGRQTEAKFSKPGPDGTQQITAWRPAPAELPVTPATASLRGSPVPAASPVTSPNPSPSPATTAGTPATPARPAGAAMHNTGAAADKGVTNG